MMFCGVLHSQNMNHPYMLSKTHLAAGIDSCAITIRYYDGLGRPFQTVLSEASPLGGDLLDWTSYNSAGAVNTQWLPMRVEDNNGALEYIFDLRLEAMPSYGDARAYNTISYDGSPLCREQTIIGPGSQWYSAGVSIGIGYQVSHPSMARSRTINYAVEYQTNNTIHIQRLSYGGVGEESVTVTTDEDGRTMRRFMDMNNHIIQEVVEYEENGSLSYLKTVYVWNDAGHLAAVFPPILSSLLESRASWSSSSTPEILQYGYYYRHDDRGRLIAKKIPGADWIYYVYDKGDRLVFCQDGNSRADGRWTFTISDALGRECLSGTCTNMIDPFDNPVGNISVLAKRSNASEALYGYELIGITLTDADVLQVDWWDNYDLPGITASYSNTMLSSGYSDAEYPFGAQGLRTGGMEKVLDNSVENTYLWDVVWYDAESRPVQALSNTAMNGMRREGYCYDFSGNLISRRIVYSKGNEQMTEDYSYTFDPWGRPLTVVYSIDGGSPVTLHDYSYDAVGRWTGDCRGDGTNHIVSSVSYNVRNAPISLVSRASTGDTLFVQHLFYGDVPSGYGYTPQWGGNVSGQRWKAGDDSCLHEYSYSYDDMSRLVSADYLNIGGVIMPENNRTYRYDYHGNITSTMIPSGMVNPIMDTTLVSYSGNQASNAYRYKKNNLFLSSYPRYDFSYDANGNRISTIQSTSLQNRDTVLVDYNLLNLPQTVHVSGYSELYTYSASGEKLSRTWSRTVPALPFQIGMEVTEHHSTIYDNNLVYVDSTLCAVFVDGGYIDMTGVIPSMKYFVRDNQGSVRAVATSNGVVSGTYSYAPYGEGISTDMQVIPFTGFTDHLSTPLFSNSVRYSGKEWDSTINGYDFGARYYSTSPIPSWTTIDPMAERYYRTSPYTYCDSNPVNIVDPQGDSLFVQIGNQFFYYENGSFFDSNGEVYDGDDPYLLAVAEALSIIESGEAGKQLVDFIVHSEQSVLVSQYGARKDNYETHGAEILGRTFDSRVRWIAYKPACGGAPAFVSLSHELVHTKERFNHDLDEGIWVRKGNYDGYIVDKDVLYSEIPATHVENMIRMEHGIPIREYYASDENGNIVPVGPLRVSSEGRSLYYRSNGRRRLFYLPVMRKKNRYAY